MIFDKRKNLKPHFFETMTLKTRIIILFLISSLIPFIFVGFISYHTLYSILNNKIQDGIRSSLEQVDRSLDSTFNNLNHVSQQLAYQGTVGRKLNILLTSEKPFERSQITAELKNEMNLITFTNPGIGLNLYYYQSTNKYKFESLPVKNGFSPEKLPLLFDYYGIDYYGPHISNYRFGNDYVLSALRKVNIPGRDDIFVYIESGFNFTQNIMNYDRSGHDAALLLLDKSGKIVYSQIPNEFPVNSEFNVDEGVSEGIHNGYLWFQQTSTQGWKIVSVISKAEYNKEINLWFQQIFFFSFLFLLLTLFIAWLLWKMVYRPLKDFNKEIGLMTNNEAQEVTSRTNIPEFDQLLKKIVYMKEQIWNLFAEIEIKEKHRRDLEVEKLMYQINPHFLMNTLNTVHWLALVNGQTEIDRLVQSLNKLLYYNLGKLGEYSNVSDEIDALKQYLILQQIRYDFDFNVQIDVDEKVSKMPIPRFILQPLVENALYHGFKEDGYIQVIVKLDKALKISIHDNGVGISKEMIDRLLNNEQPSHQKVGMGIGMNYVKRMLESQYEGKAKLEIKSLQGEGTSIYLSLPIAEVKTE